MEFKAKDRRLEGKTPLRQCQLVQLWMLEVFVEICEKYKLQYFLDAGTLIGAMRHKGFIPWDDDLDVGMPKEDYKRFLQVADRELPEGILLQTPKKFPGAAVPYAKLRDRSSFYCEVNTSTDLPSGIFMDIFPYENFPGLPLRITQVLVSWCYNSWTSERVYRTFLNGSVSHLFLSALKAFVWHVSYVMSRVVFHIAVLISPRRLKFSPEIGWGMYAGFAQEDIFPLGIQEFEGREFFVPHNSDKFLTRKFGNWRKLPPEHERRIHHSIICPTQPPVAVWARPYKGSPDLTVAQKRRG